MVRLVYVISVLVLMAPTMLAAHGDHGSDGPGYECVVMLHGMLRSSESMQDITKALRDKGYVVSVHDFVTRERNIRDMIHDRLAAEIYHSCDGASHLHFVGHSIGGLLIREYIRTVKPDNVTHVVMLGTPNHGSEMADFLRDVRLFQWLYGPAGQNLTTDYVWEDSIDYEIGVIAGNRSLDPISSIIIPGIDDGKVSLESTKLDQMTDHLTLPVTHTLMPHHPEVVRQTVHFIEHGVFDRVD